MRALLLLFTACTINGSPVSPTHPASARAPAGRLAGAPPALRPGVVTYDGLPTARPAEAPAHHHHHGQ